MSLKVVASFFALPLAASAAFLSKRGFHVDEDARRTTEFLAGFYSRHEGQLMHLIEGPDATFVDAFIKKGGVMLDFAKAFVACNNLGGYGPNFTLDTCPDATAESIRLNGVATYEDTQIDLIIVADGGYDPNNIDNNGKPNPYFAQINMKKARESTMVFTTVYHNTGEPAALPLTAISIWDFDMGKSEGKLVEQATVTNMSGFFMTSDTKVGHVDVHNGTYYFFATVYGTEADNPTDPTNLTTVQEQKVVTPVFKETSTWNITFAVSDKGSGGRNFLFGGDIPNITYSPNPCEDFTVTWFQNSTVLYSNLAGKGPDSDGKEGMKISNFIHLDGRSIDLLVVVYEEFGDYKAWDTSKNGLRGSLMNINFAPGVKARLEFTFVEGEDETPVEMEKFFVTFFDIDEENNALESLSMNTSRADHYHGYTHYYLSNDSTVIPTALETGETNFSASKKGTEDENPYDQFDTTPLVDSEAVTFYFLEKTSTFSANYAVEADAWAGRNVLIGGISPIACADLDI